MANEKPFDPGTGGFSVDGELYTFDTGVPDGEGGSQGQWSGGDVKPNKTTRDISKPTRETLGSYLGKATKGQVGASSVSNQYPVDDRNQADVKLTNDEGYPSQNFKSSNVAQFNSSVVTGRSEDALSLDMKRGKAAGNLEDGHQILAGAKRDTSPVKKYTSAVLSKNRFYSPNAPLAGTPTLRTGFVLGSSENTEEVSVDRLAQIGASLSTRAGIELKSTSTGYDPSSLGSEAGAILPGIAQLGVQRVDNVLLTAKDAFDNLDDNIDSPNYIKPMEGSWGTLNNVNDQYSGLSAVGMVALSTALVAALEVIVSTLEVLFAAGKSPKKKSSRDTIGRYALGSYYYGQTLGDQRSVFGVVSAVASLDLGKLLGVQPTTASFTNALKKGLKAFFGLDDGTNSFSLLSSVNKIADDPGFKAVVARSIIRSSLSVIDQVKKVNGNPINVARQAVGVIEILRSSKIISACNIFAQLGDALLSIPDSSVDKESLGGMRLSFSEKQSDDVYGAVGKIRLNGSLKLAYSQDRTNSLLLLPKVASQLSSVGRGLGVSNPALTLGSNGQGLTTINTGNDLGRIDPDTVFEQEKNLDAEYVPFYFQDLRTNELLSFHAFLDNLTDNFNVDYENSSGFGRVDPVMIYKNTTRTLSFSFVIAATSEADFDNMWLKINKLVMLLYPQYTAGKMITDGRDYTIRQPFSQLIGASPMIRLRIGDVIRSNYSRFNLAKLFGLGDPNVVINRNKLQPSNVSSTDVENYNKNKLATALASPEGLTFIPSEGVWYNLYEDDSKLGQLASGIKPPSLPEPLGNLAANALDGKLSGTPSAVFYQSSNAFMIKAVKRLDDKNVIGEVQLNSDLLEAQAKKLIGAKFGTDPNTTLVGNVIGAKYVFPDSTLRNTESTDIKMFDKLISVSEDAIARTISEFMSTDVNSGNAVARSFKTMGGKGLAGFITSMNMTHINDKANWELAKDRRAPKMLNVSMQFTPIHDISPGIDAQGLNRAAVYPVGLSSPILEVGTKKGGSLF